VTKIAHLRRSAKVSQLSVEKNLQLRESLVNSYFCYCGVFNIFGAKLRCRSGCFVVAKTRVVVVERKKVVRMTTENLWCEGEGASGH